MTSTDLIKFISEMFTDFIYKLYEIRDAMFGSFIVALYNHYYNKKGIKNNIIEFFIGVIFAVYVSPVLHDYVIQMNMNALSFFSGMLGMKFTHLLLATNWNYFLNKFLEKKLSEGEHKDQIDRTNQEPKQDEHTIS